MVSISTMKLSNLANDVFRTLFVRIHRETEGLAECKRKLAFEQAWKAFEQAMDDSIKPRRSLMDYDKICDNAWLLLMAQTKASTLHFDEVRAAAGAKVNEILAPIGNVTKLAYEKEYAQIRKALNQLAELDEDVLKDAHVDDIVVYLRNAYEEFMTAQQDENGLRASYQNGVVKAAKAELVEHWNRYAAYLDIQADDDETLGNVIAKINQCASEADSKRTTRPKEESENAGEA